MGPPPSVSGTFCWSEAHALRRGSHKGACEYQEAGPWSTTPSAIRMPASKAVEVRVSRTHLGCSWPTKELRGGRRFKHVSDGTTDSPHGDTAKAGPGHCPNLLNK